MSIPSHEHSLLIYEMMARLGIDSNVEVFSCAFERCVACRAKEDCQHWLDEAPPGACLAPGFCRNADILFELCCDQGAPCFLHS